MNSLVLSKLVKAAPFAMAVVSVLLLAHGVHLGANGDPGGPGGPNHGLIILSGDPGGPGGPN